MSLTFGTAFLQMHHEMVRATDSEPRQFMHHQSIDAWYEANGHERPDAWNPMERIPSDLGYEPDVDVFPREIRDAVLAAARQAGVRAEDVLRRRTEEPRFRLPGYFTRAGIEPGERPEPHTGARRLGDFRNLNQLGSCLVFPHNVWHGRIGGAMGSSWTAIADPIFYWGVHSHIDRVYEEYVAIMAERSRFARDLDRLKKALDASPSADVREPAPFADEDREQLEAFRRASAAFHSPPSPRMLAPA